LFSFGKIGVGNVLSIPLWQRPFTLNLVARGLTKSRNSDKNLT